MLLLGRWAGVAVDELVDSIAPRADEIYTLAYANAPAVVAAATTLAFPVPVGTTFVSASGYALSFSNTTTASTPGPIERRLTLRAAEAGSRGPSYLRSRP